MTQALAKAHTDPALKQITQELAELDGWEIESDEDQALATDLVKDVKRRHKALEKARKEITGPMNQALRAVNKLFRVPRERLEEAEKILKTKIASYVEFCEEANRLVVEDAANAETVEEAAAALAKVEDVSAPEGTSIRYRYVCTVTDPEKVPAHLCSPDLKKIQAWAKGRTDAEGVPLPIPGVRIEKDRIVSVRT